MLQYFLPFAVIIPFSHAGKAASPPVSAARGIDSVEDFPVFSGYTIKTFDCIQNPLTSSEVRCMMPPSRIKDRRKPLMMKYSAAFAFRSSAMDE